MARAEEALTRFIDEINKRDTGSSNYGKNAKINFGKEAIVDMSGEVVGFSEPKVTLDLAELSMGAIEQGSKAERQIHSELLAKTGLEIGQEARTNRLSSVAQEQMGFQNTVSGWVDENMPKLLNGEDLPAAIPMNPHQIASFIADTQMSLSKKYDVSPEVLGEIGYRLRSYKRMDPNLADYYGLQDYLRKKRKVPEGKESKLSYEIFAPEGVNSTLKFDMNAVQATREAKGWWQKINSAIKGNITARNLASGINNITGNFSYQTFRRGTPLLAANLAQIAAKYHGWRTGKQLKAKSDMSPIKLLPEEQSFFEAMERTGYLDVDVTDIELGGVGNRTSLLSQIPVIGKPIGWAETILEKFYKTGDNIFKLEDAWHNYKRVSKEIDVLKTGEWMDLDLGGKNKFTRMTRLDDGNFRLGDKVLTKNQLDDVLARASSQPGRGIFVDYSDVPNIVKWVRASKALGITSPFFTWAYNVMDLPGVKKGIGRRAATDMMDYRTNSVKLNAVKLSHAYLFALRRQALLAAMREGVLAEDDETLRKILSYAPKEFNLQLLELTGSPFYIGHDSVEGANQFGPSDIILRGIMAGQAALIDDEELSEIYFPIEEGSDTIDFALDSIKDPELRNDILKRRKLIKKQMSGEGLTSGDLAQLIGLSGTPIMDAVIALKEADKQGKSIDKTKLTQTLGTALAGGTIARILEIGVVALSKTLGDHGSRQYTTRRWAENSIDQPQEDMIRWSIRRMTGMGFRPMDVGSRSEWYWKNKSFEWKNSLTKDLRDMLKSPEIPLTGTDTDNINERIIELERIVDGEIMFEKLHFQKVLQKIGKPKK